MKDESYFRTVAVCFMVLWLAPTACSMNKHRVMQSMVEQGASPMEAHCALYAGWTTESTVLCAQMIATDSR